MLLSVAILLTLTGYSYGGGQPRFDRPQSYDRIATSDFITLKNSRPVRPYRLIPIPRPSSKRRSSRRNDVTFNWPQDRDLDQRIRLSGRFDEVSLRQTPRQSPRRPYLATIRRNDKSGPAKVTQEQYVQNLPSPNDPVAIPVAVSQKEANKGTNEVSQEVKSSTQKVVQLEPRPSNSNALDTRLGFDTLVGINAGKAGIFPPPRTLPGVVYQLKPDLQIPTQSVLLSPDPQPYDFGYGIDDGLGSSQFRRESTAGDGVVTGNYGYKDFQGIFRHVNYIADQDGFRAVMRTNEPSVLPVDSADVSVIVDPPPSVFVSEIS